MKKISKTKSVKKLDKPEKRVVRIIKLPNQGEPGYTPVKDKDYFDGKTPVKGVDYNDGNDGYTPQKGIDYNDGERGNDGNDGYTPIKGVDYFDGKQGPRGPAGKSFPKEEVKKMVDRTIKNKLPDLMAELEGKGQVGVEEGKDGYNLIINGKKHFVPNAVYAPKLRNFVQLGDSPGTYVGGAGKYLKVNSTETGIEYGTVSGGSGTVTSVSVTTANGVSGSVATATTTPAITLTLGAITPTTIVASGAISGSNLSGTNTGDQTNISGNAATVTTNANLSGDVSSVGNTTTIGAGKVTEAMQVLADNTTNNVSTSKHGYAPKGDGDTGKFLNANGAYSTPTGGGDVSKVGTPVNNQVGVWTGDGTIEGDAALTFDTTTDTLATTLITATTVTANLVGNVTGNVSGSSGSTTGNAATVTTNANLTGDVTSVGNAATVVKINGTTLSGLATGVLKNTTATGVPFISKVALTEPATAATLTIANNKTVTVNNTLTLAGTDGTTMTFPTTTATIARTDAANTFTGVQTFSTPIATGSVATMTATVGGGVPTPPNNTTTFLRGDGTFAAPAGGGAWTLLSYSTATAQSITISGLNLTTNNNHYQIIVDMLYSTVSERVALRSQINAVTTADSYSTVYTGRAIDWSAVTGTDKAGQNQGAQWQFTNTGGNSIHMVLDLHASKSDDGTARVAGIYKATAIYQDVSQPDFQISDGAVLQNTQTNVTSIKFFHDGTENKVWRVWILYPATA